MKILGCPSIKGNSQSIVPAKMAGEPVKDSLKEGVFVGVTDINDVYPVVSSVVATSVYGLAFDCNDQTRCCSVVRCAELAMAQTDGTAPKNGTTVLIDSSGLVSKTGVIAINGIIRGEMQPAYNGRTGEIIQNCIPISINSVMSVIVPVQTTSQSEK